MMIALSTQIKTVQDNLKSFIALAPPAYFKNWSAKDLKRLLMRTRLVDLLRR